LADVYDLSPPVSPPVTLDCLSASIDWLTATVTKPARLPFAEQVVNRWQTVRAADGYPIRSYAANGYMGSYVDGITWGTRADGAMLRLSGEMAALYAEKALVWADNVSRIDFQVTLQEPREYKNWAHIALAEFMQDERVRAGLTQYQSITSSKGGESVYLGRRASSRFYRIYNKTAESDGLWPATCWRFEVEYKPNRSQQWAAKVRERSWTPEDTRAVVARAFADYGFSLPCTYLSRGWRDRSPREPTDDQRRLEYLRKMIRPMIHKLKDSFDVDILAEALGLYDDQTQEVESLQ